MKKKTFPGSFFSPAQGRYIREGKSCVWEKKDKKRAHAQKSSAAKKGKKELRAQNRRWSKNRRKGERERERENEALFLGGREGEKTPLAKWGKDYFFSFAFRRRALSYYRKPKTVSRKKTAALGDLIWIEKDFSVHLRQRNSCGPRKVKRVLYWRHKRGEGEGRKEDRIYLPSFSPQKRKEKRRKSQRIFWRQFAAILFFPQIARSKVKQYYSGKKVSFVLQPSIKVFRPKERGAKNISFFSPAEPLILHVISPHFWADIFLRKQFTPMSFPPARNYTNKTWGGEGKKNLFPPKKIKLGWVGGTGEREGGC